MHTACSGQSRLMNAIHNIFKCSQFQEKAIEKYFEIRKRPLISKKFLIKVYFEMEIAEIIIIIYFYIYIYL